MKKAFPKCKYLFILLLLMRCYSYRKTKDISDYMTGNKSLGPMVTALSAGASDSLTVPDYLENRFKDKSKMLRLISVVVVSLLTEKPDESVIHEFKIMKKKLIN